MIPTRRAEDLFAGWWRLIEALGAVPRTLVWDGEGAIGRNRGGRVELTGDCQAFRGVLGTKVIVLKPAEPEHKGIIERAHDYLERSFLPGRVFTDPGDFNTQLQGWLAQVNTRTRRALGCAPTDRIGADRQAMLTLPPVAPAIGWRTSTRLARDHYVRLDSNDYSVHPAVIGRRIEVVADLDRVKVFSDGKTVADHERVWAWHQTLTDPDHLEAAKVMRRTRIGALRPVREADRRARRRAATAHRLRHRAGNRPGHRPGRRVRVMTARKTTSAVAGQSGRDLSSEVAFLTRALKAPTLREAVPRLAERARAESWTHEEFLVACLQREVSARESHGGEGRIRAARFPARKTLEEFDFDHARGLKRDLIAHLGTLDFVIGKRERGAPRPTRNRLTLRIPFVRVDQRVQPGGRSR